MELLVGAAELIARGAEWIEALGAAAAIAYLGVYVAASVALLPGSVLAMIAGALFGFGRGLLIACAGAVLGSSAAFVVARHGVRGPVSRWLQGRAVARHRVYARMAGLDRSIGRRGLLLVFLLRLSPIIPYNMLNYALGLTGVRFWHYALGSVGMVPAILFYVYAGHIAGDVAAAAAGHGTADAPRALLLLPALLATMVAAWVAGRYAQRELERIARSGAARG
jgi:uncharacterized membrane protein YdjX (TVP38/TMEM64 family)